MCVRVVRIQRVLYFSFEGKDVLLTPTSSLSFYCFCVMSTSQCRCLSRSRHNALHWILFSFLLTWQAIGTVLAAPHGWAEQERKVQYSTAQHTVFTTPSSSVLLTSMCCKCHNDYLIVACFSITFFFHFRPLSFILSPHIHSYIHIHSHIHTYSAISKRWGRGQSDGGRRGAP